MKKKQTSNKKFLRQPPGQPPGQPSGQQTAKAVADDAPTPPRYKRTHRVQALGNMIRHIAKRSFGQRGFPSAAIITDWSDIVGQQLAAVSVPEKISWRETQGKEGVLCIRVDGAHALDIQHMAPQVIERVNTYFGYRAIGQLKMVQVPLPTSLHDASALGSRTHPEPVMDADPFAVLESSSAAAQEDALHGVLDGLEEGSLKDSLKRLATAIAKQ